MHRRGAGLAAFDRVEASRSSYAALSNTLSQQQITQLETQLALFRSSLSSFASTHRADIARDPAFRHAFAQMCSLIGVDPLAGPRRGGWWAELMGIGDWQHELGVQIVDICVTTRARNGGIIEMEELLRLLRRLRGLDVPSKDQKQQINADDVVRSIRSLAPLGAGYEVLTIHNKTMVRSVARELDDDQSSVLGVAHELGGRVTERELTERLGWIVDRARSALENMLVRDGLCWLDEQDERDGHAYWVPSAVRWED